MLDGICPEAAELLRDKHVSMTGFRMLKKMTSVRQIEAAELMVAMNKYTISYARSLLAATPLDHEIHVNAREDLWLAFGAFGLEFDDTIFDRLAALAGRVGAPERYSHSNHRA